ncbi:cysteine desulfurase [Ferrimonas sp. YFM]|uniref:aminotransferase class V-fold PLP-dependent enzyme n=1 Tax=Ferrimonas sp. YFM TaxID=3028878 RepID=UPI002573E01E|nr:cysteine desulfurase [Ferrimonas sp. YFM]BDY06616.1 cysteine desulfurase [Ferrimonas sp. YFM]
MSAPLQQLRHQFPALNQPDLVYLDNAATTQKPERVLSAMNRFYREQNANVHRGAHRLSDLATRAFEGARDRVQTFINAPAREEVIFTRGTTESMNLLARSLGSHLLQPGDEILIDTWAHHACIVPWQQMAMRTGAKLIPIPLTPEGDLDLDAYRALLGPKTKVVSLTQVSNALGKVAPLEVMLPAARAAGAITIVDGAQAVAHLEIDVQALGCDFYAFSGHKCYGPTGIGVLWGRQSLLEQMPPYQYGGEMIQQVSFEGSQFNRLPYKFEAGTPAIAEAIGLGEALAFIDGLDRKALQAHEAELMERVKAGIAALPGVEAIAGTGVNLGALSFRVEGEHHQDIGILLDQAGIAVRCGHHCCQPLMQALGLKGSCRVSFAAYNSLEEADAFLAALKEITEFLDD